jgi:hypothetical protein
MSEIPLGGLREAYRLRRHRQVSPGRHELRPVAGDDRLFDTWRDAVRAAGGIRGRVVTQAVMVDAAGRVVFPVEDRRMPTRGRWTDALQVQVPPAGSRSRRPARRRAGPAESPQAPKPAPGRGRGRTQLSPKVVARLAEIRRQEPTFGCSGRANLLPK